MNQTKEDADKQLFESFGGDKDVGELIDAFYY
jgi:hypothetical protein